ASFRPADLAGPSTLLGAARRVIAAAGELSLHLSDDSRGEWHPYPGTDMPHRTLAPVFTGLRAGLHALFVGLLALVVVRVV
ncbi:hypothetical protein, partial [Enterococcus faecalis]|uniref:hypothetical protein n=1 Tax=Enterococcus faecalis TaxID=1351 RepID=UPI00403F33D5